MTDAPLNYMQWCDTVGKYRWYHEDGTPRTYLAFDYQWKPVYDAITGEADLYFMTRSILDPLYFTAEFLARVPLAWQKFKTEFELLTGTLDGTSISPELFNQGFTRSFKRNVDTTGIASENGTGSTTQGERKDYTSSSGSASADGKSRDISYLQGVQAYPDTGGGIGEYGNDYASSMIDHISKSDSSDSQSVTATTGKQTNTSTVSNNRTDSGTTVEEINEKVERINFYDNLAFLRDRFDRLESVKPFYSYFDDLFVDVVSCRANW